MPELPEAETVAKTLAPHIRCCVFESAELLRPDALHELSLPLSALSGAVCNGVSRRGKLIIAGLDWPEKPAGIVPSAIIFHLRMTGRLFMGEKAQGKHIRCLFHLRKPDGKPDTLFFDDTRTFGKILVATPEILDRWQFWKELGPEPLEIGPEAFAKRLKGARPVKTALMDQKVIAGIGNIYADESLYYAGISPLREAGSLTDAEAERLLKSLREVLLRSIACRGSSIRDYRDADGNEGGFQKSFAVYGRGGKKCRSCGGTLERMRLGGRATVFCPTCQN